MYFWVGCSLILLLQSLQKAQFLLAFPVWRVLGVHICLASSVLRIAHCPVTMYSDLPPDLSHILSSPSDPPYGCCIIGLIDDTGVVLRGQSVVCEFVQRGLSTQPWGAPLLTELDANPDGLGSVYQKSKDLGARYPQHIFKRLVEFTPDSII